MEEQFPALGNQSGEGFGNIVEDVENDDAVGEALISDLNALKEQLAKVKLKAEQDIAYKATKKLEHVEKVACQRSIESMPGDHFEEDTNHLTMLLATVLKHDDFDYDKDTDNVQSKQTNFLKNIEEQCAGSEIPDKEAKLSIVRNKVLEKMKRTVRRQSLGGGGSLCSGTSLAGSRAGSRTRQRSENDDMEKEPASKVSKSSQERKSRLPAPASQPSQ